MTTEELENSIELQMRGIFQGQPVATIIEEIKKVSIEYANQFKTKAENWDKLDAKIAKCYFDENGDELSEEDSENIDLGTIGEIAASEFGYL